MPSHYTTCRTRPARLFTLITLAISTSMSAACNPNQSVSLTPLGQHGSDDGDAHSPAPAATTLSWNAFTRTLVERNQPNQQAALRVFAYASLAAHQSLAALDSAMRSVPEYSRGREPLMRTALSVAHAEVLRAFFPREVAAIDQMLTQSLGMYAHPSIAIDGDDGAGDRMAMAQEIGRHAGEQLVARAQNDGFDVTWSGAVPTGAGIWASAFNPARPPLLPLLGQARTFFMTRGDQFRAPPPPSLTSRAFIDALAEVRQISETRTAEQVRIAQAWAMTTGSLAAGYWNAVADSLITKYRITEREAAHLYALMNAATWDANVACHDTKYSYWLARPTQMDPKITLAIGLPNHPSYPSNHACLSGTAAEILAARFPEEGAPLRARAQEAMISRVYAGVHYRFDGEAGLEIARRVSALALAIDASGMGPTRGAR